MNKVCFVLLRSNLISLIAFYEILILSIFCLVLKTVNIIKNDESIRTVVV